MPKFQEWAIGHNAKNTVGLFWLNAAETWVDVKKEGSGVLDSISSVWSGTTKTKRVDSHWISESGLIDFFVMLGPSPRDVTRQGGVETVTLSFGTVPRLSKRVIHKYITLDSQIVLSNRTRLLTNWEKTFQT